jgi:hypothetical protein
MAVSVGSVLSDDDGRKCRVLDFMKLPMFGFVCTRADAGVGPIPLDRPAECSTFVLMEVGTLGVAREAWLEGAYALRQRLSRGHQVYEALRLSQAA